MGRCPPVTTWRLNPALLDDGPFRESLHTLLETYFPINANTASTVQVEWEAFKVVVRGHCLGQATGVYRALCREVLDLEDSIRRLDNTQGTRAKARLALQEARTRYNEALGHLRCYNYNEYLDRVQRVEGKAGRLLARLIQPELAGSPITQLETEAGGVRFNPDNIDSFTSYYEYLYKAPEVAPCSAVREFMEPLSLKELTD